MLVGPVLGVREGRERGSVAEGWKVTDMGKGSRMRRRNKREGEQQ